MKDTWTSRDLPVLDAIVAQLDELSSTGATPETVDIAASTELDTQDVVAALIALDGDYITVRRTLASSAWDITAVTPAARRAVGQWPTGESLIEKLASGLAQAADREADPDQKRRLTAVARELGGAAKSIAINVASGMLEHKVLH